MSPNQRLSSQDAWSAPRRLIYPAGTVSPRFIRRFAAAPSHVARPPLRAFSDIARRGPAPLADRPPLAVLATIALLARSFGGSGATLGRVKKIIRPQPHISPFIQSAHLPCPSDLA